MRNRPPLRLLLWCALWVTLAARADTPTPPPGFWEYMAEFSDQDGKVFDPIDLSEAQKVAHANTQASARQTEKSAQSKPREEQQP